MLKYVPFTKPVPTEHAKNELSLSLKKAPPLQLLYLIGSFIAAFAFSQNIAEHKIAIVAIMFLNCINLISKINHDFG